MKIGSFLIIAFTLLSKAGGAQHSPATAPLLPDSITRADAILSPQKMQADLRIFRQIRDSTNSGLYRYRSRKEIDSSYRWAYRQTRRPLSTTAFYRILLQLTDLEGSTHNYTELPKHLLNAYNTQKAFFPYALKFIEGKIIFNQRHKEIPLGARIVSINGLSDTALMQSFYKYITTDGYNQTAKWSGSVDNSFGLRYLLEHGIQRSFVVGFISPGTTSIQSVTLQPVLLSQRQQMISQRHSAHTDSVIDYNVQDKYSFKMINDSTALLNLRIFNMASSAQDPAFKVYANYIDSIFHVLKNKQVGYLVIDIRNNPGGSDPTFEQPMMYLTDSSFKENLQAYSIFRGIPYLQYFWGTATNARITAQELEQGRAFLKDYFLNPPTGLNYQNPAYNPVYHPKQPSFRGKLYLLIDENVGSAASHFASLMKAYARNLTVVGVETSGGYYVHNGHVAVVYELPNSKIKTKFSVVYVVQDAPLRPDQPEGHGTIPHFEVWPTFDDFMQQRDTQMEYVLLLIRQGVAGLKGAD